MKKQKATRILQELELQQYKSSVDPDWGNPDWQHDDFITVYYNIGDMKNLRWCNTVNDALEVIESLPSIAVIALDVSDDFME